MTGLTNDERGLSHSLRVELHRGSERLTKMFLNKRLQLNRLANNKIVQKCMNTCCFAVYMAVYMDAVERVVTVTFFGPPGGCRTPE